ncbi:MAG: hypothetical protein GX958_01900, partial [Desulfitobacterium sp.]|nr:hypothetical protein [Desulfitobacterium sp.]
MTREFLVDINPNIELPKYELILYNLYEQPITSLKNITDFNYKAFFIGIDEISFNIPAYRNEYDGQKVRNEIYDLVDGEYYILLNDKKYFIIDKINENADDDGDLYKEIHAYSREYELSQKKVIDYKADSRLLYDSSNSIDENGLEKGILNYIFNHVTKSWSIGDIDVDLTLNEVYRALDFPNTNLIQVFQELQKIYNCIFMFDTINQKIDILKMDSQKIGQNKGLYISDGNFIKSLSKNINYDEVKTRLFVYGKDNISIQSISPTGQPYLDNFDTFKNTKFMTQDLIDALNSYQVKIENYNPDFEPLLTQLQEANQVMENLINADDIDVNNKGLVALERALSNVQTLIDVKTEELAIVRKSIESATGTDLESLYADMKSIQSALDGYETEKENINTLIANKQAEIDNQQGVIDGIKQQMADLQYVLDINNPANFTAEQLKELDKFIRIETYNDSNYTENNIAELYEEGKKMLAKISQPQIQFDVDVVDFLSIVECQHVWKKFILGDIITLEHKELGFDFEVRLVGYEHNEEENSLNLKFSNTYTFDDDTLWMRDLLDE